MYVESLMKVLFIKRTPLCYQNLIILIDKKNLTKLYLLKAHPSKIIFWENSLDSKRLILLMWGYFLIAKTAKLSMFLSIKVGQPKEHKYTERL